MKDTDLIQGLLNRQTGAINYFVNNYQQFVFVLCVKMVNNEVVAEEITQDVLIKCIEKIESFNQQAQLKTWVYTIAKRETLNYLRVNRPETIELKESSGGQVNEIQESFDREDLKSLIQDLFEQLNADQKEVLTLFYLEELSLKEISELTGLSESNVRVKLHRARERFRDNITKKELSLLNQIRYE